MTETAAPLTRITWCADIDGPVDHRCDRDKRDHVHYDVAVDAEGSRVLRYWPVGTVFRCPDGDVLTLDRYEARFADLIESEDPDSVPERPAFNGVSLRGGAYGYSGDLPEGSVVIGYVLDPTAARIPRGTLFVLPSGDAYRLRDYRPKWDDDEPDVPNWTVNYVGGGTSTASGTLDGLDPRLVWTP